MATSSRKTKEGATVPDAAAAAAATTDNDTKTLYLAAYNFVSAVLWLNVLTQTASAAALRGPDAVHGVVGTFLRLTQSLALLEVAHAALGVVRAPLATTALQIASRLLLVWGVTFPFPAATTTSSFYTSMLIAWSLTEVIRYGYFALALTRNPEAGGPAVPAWLTRLRYSTFLVLYPVGIASEVRLVYLAATTSGAAESLHPLYPYALYAVLAIYVPGSYVLYTYMLAQRRKVLRRLRAEEQVEGAKKAN